MGKYLLASACVTVIAVMALTIDVTSSPSVRHSSISRSVDIIAASGRIEGAAAEIELRPRLNGQVKVEVVKGQIVAAGQTLLRVDVTRRQHEVALAEAQVALAQAQLQRLQNGAHRHQREEVLAVYQSKLVDSERAAREWRRAEQLLTNNAISADDAERRHADWRTSQAEAAAAKARADLVLAPARQDDVRIAQSKVDVAKGQLALAQEQLDRTRLTAPCVAKVLQINVETGEQSGPDAAVPAIVLADVSRFRVRAFVEELDAPRVQIGMKATITADGMPGKTLYGRVSQVSPGMDRKRIYSDDPAERYDTKTREVWIDLRDVNDLIIGLRVDVQIDSSPNIRSIGAN